MINIQAMTISKIHQWYTYFILVHAVSLGENEDPVRDMEILNSTKLCSFKKQMK